MFMILQGAALLNQDDSNGSKTEQGNKKAQTIIEKLLNEPDSESCCSLQFDFMTGTPLKRISMENLG